MIRKPRAYANPTEAIRLETVDNPQYCKVSWDKYSNAFRKAAKERELNEMMPDAFTAAQYKLTFYLHHSGKKGYAESLVTNRRHLVF